MRGKNVEFGKGRSTMCRLITGIYIFLFISSATCLLAAEQDIIEEINEYGGRTFEISNQDGSFIRIFYDDDEIKIKEETIFTIDYPVENGLDKIISYYAFDKKVKEERIFSNRVSENTLIKKTIDHFDRFADPNDKSAILKTENHFLDEYNGRNVVYWKDGMKAKIEWFYPLNIDGIEKNIIYFDDKEMSIRVESFYTEKTRREKGFKRRVYYNEYSPNKYFRKARQEWFYTDEYAERNKGVAKRIEVFHYSAGSPVRIETNHFNRKGEKIFGPVD